MPFGLAPWEAAFMAAALFAAAFVRGYSGFGFAALAVSSAALVTNPLHFVPVVLVADFAMTAQQARDIRPDIDWRRVGALGAGAVAGVPLGVWVLSSVGVDQVRLFLSLFILAMCALLLAGLALPRPAGMVAHGGVGVISGIANGAAVGGLPVAVFFAAQPIAPAVFRATLIAYFTLLDFLTVPALALAGFVTAETLLATALGAPFLAAGIWAGGKAFRRGNPQGFRRFAIGVLAVLALIGLWRGGG
ncbi:MAG: TSUP family transporter [Gemmobacter sp.]